MRGVYYLFFFFFNDTATTEIYTLSLHDALPICARGPRPLREHPRDDRLDARPREWRLADQHLVQRSEEHTSELQSQSNLVCRLLLEKKKNKQTLAYRAANSIACFVTISYE